MGTAQDDFLTGVKKMFRSSKPSGHGPFYEANSGAVDPKPYAAIYSNGMFEGYDGSLWIYFGIPRDVKIDWVSDPSEIVDNQSFLNTMFKEIGSKLDNQTERTRGDVRRDFHIVMTQDEFQGIRPYPGITPAHADYLARMSLEFKKPDWYGYVGFQLMTSSSLYDAHGLRNKAREYIDQWKNPDMIKMALYREDIDFLNNLMTSPGMGFRPLDFLSHNEMDNRPGSDDYEQLTAWYGVSDEKFGVERKLDNTRIAEPVHGLSMIVPKTWGQPGRSSSEISFQAIRPREDMFLVDPESNHAQWGAALYTPNLNLVSINIRGEIRSARVAANAFDQKQTSKEKRNQKQRQKGNYGNVDKLAIKDATKLDIANTMVENNGGTPFLDNVEIIVGHLVTEQDNKLNAVLKNHGMMAAPVVDRQPLALLSTLPTYPKQVFRIKKGNNYRSVMTNQILPGIIAFSGLFRSTRPAEKNGIILGLNDSGYEYKEIYATVDAAYRESAVPGFLISGRPGSGKTQCMLQICEQSFYQGFNVTFLNPKREATLKPVFDHLGGTTITMSTQFLEENPGLLDPVFYYDNLVPDDGKSDKTRELKHGRSKVADVLGDAIFTALKWRFDHNNMIENSNRMNVIKTQIRQNAQDLKNKCSYDILFGNKLAGTNPIEKAGGVDILKFVADKMLNSPFWGSLISQTDQGSDLQKRMMQNRAILIEWDGSLQLPDSKSKPENYSPEQIDSLLSVNVAFLYSIAILSNKRSGGVLACDESWIFKGSEEVKQILNTGFREWRQANIMLLMGTQKISDWAGGGVSEDDMTTFFGRILMMALTENDDNEIDLFYKFSGLKRSPRYTNYIVNAAIDKVRRPGQPPRAFYADNISKWKGPIITGPYPELELNLGRTDKEGEERRRKKEAANSKAKISSGGNAYGGVLSQIIDDNLGRVLSEEEAEQEYADNDFSLKKAEDATPTFDQL